MHFSQFELMTDIHISPFHWQIKLHFYIIFILEYLFFQYPSSGQHTVHLKHLNHRETWGHLQLPSESKFFSLFTSDFAGLVSSDFIKFSLRKKIFTSATLTTHNQAKSSVTFQTAFSESCKREKKKSFPRKTINKEYPIEFYCANLFDRGKI